MRRGSKRRGSERKTIVAEWQSWQPKPSRAVRRVARKTIKTMGIKRKSVAAVARKVVQRALSPAMVKATAELLTSPVMQVSVKKPKCAVRPCSPQSFSLADPAVAPGMTKASSPVRFTAAHGSSSCKAEVVYQLHACSKCGCPNLVKVHYNSALTFVGAHKGPSCSTWFLQKDALWRATVSSWVNQYQQRKWFQDKAVQCKTLDKAAAAGSPNSFKARDLREGGFWTAGNLFSPPSGYRTLLDVQYSDPTMSSGLRQTNTCNKVEKGKCVEACAHDSLATCKCFMEVQHWQGVCREIATSRTPTMGNPCKCRNFGKVQYGTHLKRGNSIKWCKKWYVDHGVPFVLKQATLKQAELDRAFFVKIMASCKNGEYQPFGVGKMRPRSHGHSQY